jgi:hypothetical protein
MTAASGNGPESVLEESPYIAVLFSAPAQGLDGQGDVMGPPAEKPRTAALALPHGQVCECRCYSR